MGRNLGPLNIKDSYEGLVQISGSARDTLTDGSGSVITLLDISSSYAISASHALNSDVAISSSYALTASFALNSSASQSLQQVTNVGNITTNNIQAPVFFTTVSTGIDKVSVSLETLGSDEPFILTNSSKVLEFDSAISSSKFAVYDVDVQTALTASGLKYPTADGTVGQVMTTDGAGNLTLQPSGGSSVNTGSFYFSSSVVDATATFNQGDGSTESLTINNVANAVSASHAVSSDTSISASYALSSSYAAFATTASYALNVTPINTGSFYISSSVLDATATFNKGDGTTDSLTINNVANAVSASYALSSSYALTSTSASHAVNSDTSISASHAISSDTSISASYALSSSFATNALSASYAPSEDAFPYTGSATILGTLDVNTSGSLNGYTITSGSLSGSLVDNLGQQSVVTSQSINHMVFLTQAEYDGLTPEASTFYAISGSSALATGSFYYSSSVVDATATFYQGDGSTESLTINNVASALNATSASYAPTNVSDNHVWTGTNQFNSQVNADIVTGGTTGTVNIDFETGNFFTVTPAALVTITPTNTAASKSQTVSIVIDNAASQTVNFSGILWAGGTAPTITAAGVDIVTLVSFGTTVYGTTVQNLS